MGALKPFVILANDKYPSWDNLLGVQLVSLNFVLVENDDDVAIFEISILRKISNDNGGHLLCHKFKIM